MKVIRLKEVDSTNRYLHDCQPLPDGQSVLVVADYQTAGRGQGSNTWESEPGKNLLFSLAIQPKFVPVRRQFLLAKAEALAIKEALDNYTDGITLKWPNDVYWQDRKISGTLIETSLSAGAVKRCVFGTGIDVNQREFYSDAPNPVSLYQILGHEVPLDELLQKVVNGITANLELLAENQFADISTRYHAALYRRTGYHKYQDAESMFEAALVEVEDDGHLVLHDRQGLIRRYAFKEVTFVLEEYK